MFTGYVNTLFSCIDRISYCPKSVGKYAIHVLDSEQNTAGKPIKVDVFDPNMIKLSKIGDAVLGQDNRIRVDTGIRFASPFCAFIFNVWPDQN